MLARLGPRPAEALALPERQELVVSVLVEAWVRSVRRALLARLGPGLEPVRQLRWLGLPVCRQCHRVLRERHERHLRYRPVT